jgi:glycosyltransferase involved in cell wall biosynthesis
MTLTSPLPVNVPINTTIPTTVRALTASSIWTPGRDYGQDKKPAVTVILPTFKRGANGWFKRAANSVLTQTFTNLELIVVDDGSTDGTEAVLTDLMAQDGRVSGIRHPKNVGIPAISTLEAYYKAQGEWLFFVFDDNEILPEALNTLYQATTVNGTIKHHWLCGYVSVYLNHDKTDSVTLGNKPLTLGQLQITNTIPNAGMLIHRSVFEAVGWYDPHIALTRVCDWDLWQRIEAYCPLKQVDVLVGYEYGAISKDSLGNSYWLDHWLVNEWMHRSDRNQALLPSTLLDYDICHRPPDLSVASRHKLDELTRFHEGKHHWGTLTTHQQPQRNAVIPDGMILLVVMDYNDSIQRYFYTLAPTLKGRLWIISAVDAESAISQVCFASCVIFAHNLFGQKRLKKIINDIGIPAYFFTDQDFVTLHQSGHPDYSAYTPQALQSIAPSFAGFLLATPEAMAQCQQLALETNTDLLCPNTPSPISPFYTVADQTIITLLERHPCFGFFTVQHRIKRFMQSDFAAIHSLISLTNWFNQYHTSPQHNQHKATIK